jgi:hypothetical protein
VDSVAEQDGRNVSSLPYSLTWSVHKSSNYVDLGGNEAIAEAVKAPTKALAALTTMVETATTGLQSVVPLAPWIGFSLDLCLS